MDTTTRRPMLSATVLESICRTIADTNEGLTGTEIDHFLASVQIEDIDAGNTKWKRLYNAFVH